MNNGGEMYNHNKASLPSKGEFLNRAIFQRPLYYCKEFDCCF